MQPEKFISGKQYPDQELADVSIFINTTESVEFVKSLFTVIRKCILDNHLDPAVVKYEYSQEAKGSVVITSSRYFLKLYSPDSSTDSVR